MSCTICGLRQLLSDAVKDRNRCRLHIELCRHLRRGFGTLFVFGTVWTVLRLGLQVIIVHGKSFIDL